VLVGVSIPQTGRLADVAAVRAAAVAAEELAYASLWAMDPDPRSGVSLDPVGALTVAATVTARTRLGTSVLAAPSYLGPQLARSLATLDHASGGRLTIGLGLGRPRGHNAGDRSGRSRAERLESALDHLDAAWAEHNDARACASRRPSVLLAATGPAGFERIARRADGWNPHDPTVEELRAGWSRIRDEAGAAGRDPAVLRLVARVTLDVTDRPLGRSRPLYAGSAEQVADDVAGLAGAGVHEVVLGWRGDPSLDEVLDRCARVTEHLGVAAAG
jgi:alkanesulfonate monooxygenase SsuD/methylene tetrahydromethanopterin reductase-like flavin-dependent oxidoreductase (luciferase family)